MLWPQDYVGKRSKFQRNNRVLVKSEGKGCLNACDGLRLGSTGKWVLLTPLSLLSQPTTERSSGSAVIWGRASITSGGFCGLGHGHNLFNEVIQVPLLISGPLPGRGAAGLVSSVDIVPTVLDVLGVRHSMRLDGHSVFADAAPERYLLTEACASGYEKKALVIGGYKLIYSEDDGIAWLFDLERDPGERTPIVDSGLTSVYVHKLLRILEADERSRIRRIAERKGLSRAVRRGAGR